MRRVYRTAAPIYFTDRELDDLNMSRDRFEFFANYVDYLPFTPDEVQEAVEHAQGPALDTLDDMLVSIFSNHGDVAHDYFYEVLRNYGETGRVEYH